MKQYFAEYARKSDMLMAQALSGGGMGDPHNPYHPVDCSWRTLPLESCVVAVTPSHPQFFEMAEYLETAPEEQSTVIMIDT